MSRLQSFLEHMVGAGLIPSAEQILGDEQQVAEMEKMLGVDPADYQSLKEKNEELDARVRGQDSKISKYDNQIKDLQRQLEQKSTDVGDVTTTSQQMMANLKKEMDETYGEKLNEVLNLLQQQTQKAQQLEAKVTRQNALTSLAEEFPVLKDPKFHGLMPETADENVLRERATLLTQLRDATENHAYEEIRAGRVPATMPPRVIPGKPETLERELNSIAARRDRGEITPQQAGAQMDEVMKLFNK